MYMEESTAKFAVNRIVVNLGDDVAGDGRAPPQGAVMSERFPTDQLGGGGGALLLMCGARLCFQVETCSCSSARKPNGPR